MQDRDAIDSANDKQGSELRDSADQSDVRRRSAWIRILPLASGLLVAIVTDLLIDEPVVRWSVVLAFVVGSGLVVEWIGRRRG